MTPLDIELLLHYHCRACDFERLDAPAVRESLDHFLREGILRSRSEADGAAYPASYIVTEKGFVLVQALCATPYPVQRWVMPERDA